jgi:N-carbamoylputrescine amidase
VADARIGILVCTDLWFFEWARHYARSGVDLLCLPRATPYDSLGRWLAGGAGSRDLFWRLLHVLQTSGILPALGSTAVASVGGRPDGTSWPQPQPRSRSSLSRLILDIARQAKSTYPRYVSE